MGVSSVASLQSIHFRPAIPRVLSRLIYRLFNDQQLWNYSEYKYATSTKNDDICYIWPGTRLKLYQKLKDEGKTIIRESINCHQAVSKNILDSEYQRLGLIHQYEISDQKIAVENEILSLSDNIFSPSPNVTSSLLLAGIERDKIIESSYGLSENDRILSPHNNDADSPFTAIFVGRVGVRKGVHLLLDYWAKAGVKGKLKVIGAVEEPVRKLIEPYKSNSSIEFIDFVQDLRPHYQEADLFIFPTLEEGSPLVTYLALGAGLPCLVSPMGGSGIITDNKCGRIIEPHSEDDWVAAIRRFADDHEYRRVMGESAWRRSDYFLWSKVGARRVEALEKKLRDVS